MGGKKEQLIQGKTKVQNHQCMKGIWKEEISMEMKEKQRYGTTINQDIKRGRQQRYNQGFWRVKVLQLQIERI